jgi:hypothetical protein
MSNTYTTLTFQPALNSPNYTSGLPTNANTWYNTNITGGSNPYVAAFYDGEQRARVFDASVALPQLNANFAPPGVNPYQALASFSAGNGLYQASAAGAVNNGIVVNVYQDAAGVYHIGEVLFQLTYAAGSLDSGSPSVFGVDSYLTLVLTSASQG